MKLHFYPGQKLLVVTDDSGKVLKKYEAWGGPAKMGADPRMAEEPTWPGNYVIDKAHPYVTPSWPMSKIKWGTELKDMPAKNDVWYKLPNGQWASISKDLKLSRQDIIATYNDLYGLRRVPSNWVFNDFGPVAIRWFKDLNNNKKLDGKETLSGQMFHTTPKDEASVARGLSLNLVESHGCIHLKPNERDEIFKLGAFRQGTPFVVHEYNETFKN